MRQKRNDDVVREKVSTLGCGFFPENVHGFLQDFHGSFSGLRCELLSRHPLSPALHCTVNCEVETAAAELSDSGFCFGYQTRKEKENSSGSVLLHSGVSTFMQRSSSN